MPDFKQLRDLADLLDLHLGVQKRKDILQGNERLTLRTQQRDWTTWIDGVKHRLDGLERMGRARLLLQSLSSDSSEPDPSTVKR